MPTRLTVDDEVQQALLARLRRIEGQIRGLQRMLEEERDCTEIAQQTAAVRSAVDQVFMQIVAAGLEQCIRRDVEGDPKAKDALRKVSRVFKMLT